MRGLQTLPTWNWYTLRGAPLVVEVGHAQQTVCPGTLAAFETLASVEEERGSRGVLGRQVGLAGWDATRHGSRSVGCP